MTYREPAENQSRAKRSAAEERLQRQLDEETRAREEKERKAKERAERAQRLAPTPEQVEHAKARERRLECYPIRFRDVLFALSVFGGIFALRFIFFDSLPGDDESDPWTGTAVMLGMLLGWAWLYLSPRLQMRSEERSFSRLPFRVLGSVEALERDLPYRGLHATMTIALRPEIGEVREDLLQKLAQRIYPPTSATTKHEDDRVYCVLRSEDLTDSKFCSDEDSEPKGRKYRRWMRQALDKTALPLSEVYPIESVKF